MNFGNSLARETFYLLPTVDQVKFQNMIAELGRKGYWHEIITANRFGTRLEIVIRIHGELNHDVIAAGCDSVDSSVSK